MQGIADSASKVAVHTEHATHQEQTLERDLDDRQALKYMREVRHQLADGQHVAN